MTADEPRPVAIVTDHDAEDRATLEKALAEGWGVNFPVRTQGAYKAVSAGIQAVGTRLKVAGDGKSRLFYLKNSVVDIDPTLSALHHPTCT